jgi:preprotein translocase subunit SecD
LAIILDNCAQSAPMINSRIEAEGLIEGHFIAQQAEDLALLLRSGPLPASVIVLKQKIVSPQKAR